MINLKHNIYFDNVSSTPIREEVVDLMSNVMKNIYGNPSSSNKFGKQAKSIIENYRIKLANILNISPSNLYFTFSCTYANNFIIMSCIKSLKVDKIITSKLEHKSILEVIKNLPKNIEIIYIKHNSNGDIDYNNLEKTILNCKTKTLISIMHGNNEIGNINDIKRIATICKKNANCFFHSDLSQTIGHYDININNINLDFATFSAHKVYGPKGIGFVYINNYYLNPIYYGGKQEKGIFPSTENIYAIIGGVSSIELALKNLNTEKKKIYNNKKYFIDNINKLIPFIKYNGQSQSMTKSLYTLVSLFIPFKIPFLVFILEMKGISCSDSSACSSLNKVSHVMSNLYPSDVINNNSFLRVSFSYKNTIEEIDYFTKVLLDIFTNYNKISL